MIVANSIEDLIGNTPMIRINNLTGKDDARIYSKLEWYNVGGSIKDRMALYLINYAAAKGKLKKDKRIIEATSGNTGIALAMIASVKGYKITIVMPESVSIERRKMIRAYGAELILSPADRGTGGAIEVKKNLLMNGRGKYIDINQHSDPANILAHYETTGREILEQTNGKVDMVVVGIGTAGTGVGISMRMKEHNKEIKMVGVMPKLGASIQGLRNPKESNPTKLFRRESFDEIVEIEKDEVPKVYDTARRIAKEEGLLVGMSSAAIMYVALKKARELGKGKTIVTIMPDNGDKYLSTELFE
ncbi:MAG: cysteine synthase family protein [Candidatus Aenigmatarchaeota archaeon]